MNTEIRLATQQDLDLLWEFLAIAAYEPNAEAARNVPMVASHLRDWQRACDFGIVALENGNALGAAWARQFTLDESPSFFVNFCTPEVSIGVREEARGKGVGDAILVALIAEARRRDVGLCLNVRDTNPAQRLYAHNGFQRVTGSEVRNRVGGTSFGMHFEA